MFGRLGWKALVVLGAIAGLTQSAAAECDCVAIAADVAASVRPKAIEADSLYAAGDYAAAVKLYADGYAATKDAAFLYAQAQCYARLGSKVKAKALFDQYLKAGAGLKYEARAQAALEGGLDAVADLAPDAAGDIDAKATGAVGGAAGAAVGAGASLSGKLKKKAKPPKVAKGAAILLGVVAVAAVGAVGVQSVTAGLKDDVDFDTKFNIGLGATGVVVGGTAIYLYGLTAAAGATSGAVDCPTVASGPIVTPVAHRGGAGVAFATSF